MFVEDQEVGGSSEYMYFMYLVFAYLSEGTSSTWYDTFLHSMGDSTFRSSTAIHRQDNLLASQCLQRLLQHWAKTELFETAALSIDLHALTEYTHPPSVLLRAAIRPVINEQVVISRRRMHRLEEILVIPYKTKPRKSACHPQWWLLAPSPHPPRLTGNRLRELGVSPQLAPVL